MVLTQQEEFMKAPDICSHGLHWRHLAHRAFRSFGSGWFLTTEGQPQGSQKCQVLAGYQGRQHPSLVNSSSDDVSK